MTHVIEFELPVKYNAFISGGDISGWHPKDRERVALFVQEVHAAHGPGSWDELNDRCLYTKGGSTSSALAARVADSLHTVADEYTTEETPAEEAVANDDD